MPSKLKLLPGFLLVLLIAGNVFAAGPNWVGNSRDYLVFDSADPTNYWTSHAKVIGTEVIGAYEYFQVGHWNWKSVGSYDVTRIRHEDNAAFFYSNAGDQMVWQVNAPINTTWNVIIDEDNLPPGYIEKTIVAITEVTVPYASFSEAYVHKNVFYSADEQSASSYAWYDFIVPNVGNVMTVDYNTENPPTYKMMTDITVVPEPISSILFIIGGATLGFRRFRKTIKN